jgi:hypothetical protein
VGVIVDVSVGVSVKVLVMVGVGVLVGVGSRATTYWNRSAQGEIVQAVQVAQVPLLPKISGPPLVSQALTMYLTVVPPGCAGMLASTTSTTCPPWERSMKVQE